METLQMFLTLNKEQTKPKLEPKSKYQISLTRTKAMLQNLGSGFTVGKTSSGFYKIRYEIGVGWQKKLQLLGSFRDRDWRLADQSSGKRSEVHMELGNIAVL